jgi:small subunit ribosomal protein S8e
LDHGNFAWASQGTARKTRVLDVVYNASNNELVRTKTLVKNCIISIDATPFKQYYEAHYLLPLGRKKDSKVQLAEGEEDPLTKKRGKDALKKYEERQKFAKVEPALEEQFLQGRLLGELRSDLDEDPPHSKNDDNTSQAICKLFTDAISF